MVSRHAIWKKPAAIAAIAARNPSAPAPESARLSSATAAATAEPAAEPAAVPTATSLTAIPPSFAAVSRRLSVQAPFLHAHQ